MSREPIELANLLFEAASNVDALVSEAAPQLVGIRFNSEVLMEAGADQASDRRTENLPAQVIAKRLDNVPVLIGVLTGLPIKGNLEAQLRRYRNQATIARSWLASEAPNLQLFLISPEQARRDLNWRQLAAEIEADDRTCRKLVWLLDAAPTPADAKEFLDRTFLARPWPRPTEQRKELLDGIASFSLPAGWEEALDEDLDYNQLVEELIQIEQGAGA